MSKISDAQDILSVLGLPPAQQNEISALTLLALCGLKEEDNWADATRKSLKISKDIMAFVNENYKKEQPYAPNTRETFRRQVLHQFLQARIVDYNPDNPALPVNSPNAHYKLTEEAYETIKSYNTQEWEIKAQNFNDAVGRLIEEYEKSREMEMIPVTIEGKEFKLSPGKHNEVQAAVINEFAPRFAAGAKVLYDVGAGTGSVSVELSLMAGQADVYAIECEEKAVELIGKNRERFGCGNLHVVFGKAPQALDSLPAPDAVFIGGTKGNLPEILSILFEKNPSVRIVVTAILLETALQACESLEAFTLKPAEIMQLQVSRSKKAGKGHMLCANNPIFLISAGGCADE